MFKTERIFCSCPTISGNNLSGRICCYSPYTSIPAFLPNVLVSHLFFLLRQEHGLENAKTGDAGARRVRVEWGQGMPKGGGTLCLVMCV